MLVVADILISCAFVNGGKLLGESFCAMSEIQRSRFIRFRSERVLTSLVLREARAIGPDMRIRVDGWYAKAAGAIDSYLRTATERGLLREGMSDATAWALLGVTERAIHYACEINTEMSSDALADELLLLELTGLLGDRSGTPDTPRPPKTDGRTGAGPPGRDQ